MKKRTFLKLSAALAAAPVVGPFKAYAQKEKLKNWAGNLEYSTSRIDYPKTIPELQKLVKKYSRFKILGTRHCFNNIADSKDQFISLRDMNKVIALDEQKQTVTVEGGIKYGDLCPWLHERGYALHNLASLPHISIAGAVTTATHGSGVKNGNLSTAVSGLEVITADGNLVEFSAGEGEHFNAVVVGLGAVGVITKLTLNLQKTFQMRQYVYERLPLNQLRDHFEAIMSAGYSVSLFTDWQQDSINEVWIKNRADSAAPPAEFFGATAATKNMHPIADLSAENCTEQMGVPGPWFERMPHFKMGFTPSSGKELQAEYFVPMENAVEALFAVQRLGKQIGPHLFISEIRTIDADQLWMSPCFKQGSVTIHFTWKQEWDAVIKLLPVIERELEAYHVRPHWGKLFTIPPARLASLYEKMPSFKQIVATADPNGKLRNAFINRNLFGK